METPNKQIVIAVWDDAHASHDATTEEEAHEIAPVRTYTVGWVLARNQHGIVLTPDLYDDPDMGAGGNYFIPWGMVVKVIECIPS